MMERHLNFYLNERIFLRLRSEARELQVRLDVWERRSVDDSSLTEGDLNASLNHSLCTPHPPSFTFRPSSFAATRSNAEAEEDGGTQNTR